MTDEKKPRRRLTPEEKIARAQSQIDMVKTREKEKQRERVQEAAILLTGMSGSNIDAARASLALWLAENVS